MEVLFFLIGILLTLVISQPGLELVQRLRRRITWRRFTKGVRNTLAELERQGWTPDVVVGLNSGIVPASILALNLRVRDVLFYESLPEYRDGRRQVGQIEDKQVDLSGQDILIVDDQAYTGRSLDDLYKHLVTAAKADPSRVKRHALFTYEAGAGPVEMEIPAYGRVRGGVKEMPWVISGKIKHYWKNRA